MTTDCDFIAAVRRAHSGPCVARARSDAGRVCLSTLLLLAHPAGWAGISEDILDATKAAERRMRVPVIVASSNQVPDWPQERIAFQPVVPAELPSALRLLRLHTEEFGKYPRSLAQRSNLSWVLYGRGLRLMGEPISGTMLSFVGAMKEPPRGGLVFDIRADRESESFQRGLLHHEFFHLVDDVLFWDTEDRRRWMSLNTPGFAYARSSGACGGSPHESDGHPGGFVSDYAMASVMEDRAETFAALFESKTYRRLRALEANDPILRSKVRYMIRLLHQIDPSIDEAFFRRLHEVKR